MVSLGHNELIWWVSTELLYLSCWCTIKILMSHANSCIYLVSFQLNASAKLWKDLSNICFAWVLIIFIWIEMLIDFLIAVGAGQCSWYIYQVWVIHVAWFLCCFGCTLLAKIVLACWEIVWPFAIEPACVYFGWLCGGWGILPGIWPWELNHWASMYGTWNTTTGCAQGLWSEIFFLTHSKDMEQHQLKYKFEHKNDSNV